MTIYLRFNIVDDIRKPPNLLIPGGNAISMTLTIARPVLKNKTARKVQSINKVSKDYYEVVGASGNVYHYDSWADCCNCPAGQKNIDCYHAKAVRQLSHHESLNQEEYLFDVKTSDISETVNQLGLIAFFKGKVTINSTWGRQPAMLIQVHHKGYYLCDIHCMGSMFTITNHITGNCKTHSPNKGQRLETLKYNLKKLRDINSYWSNQETENSWGEINAGL